MDERRLSVKEIREFMAAELFFGLLLFLRYYEAWVNLMNGTVLAFSYKYGFISRGLVGTFYQWLDRVLPFDMMRYQAVVNYTLIVTMIFYGVMAAFLCSACGEERGRSDISSCSLRSLWCPFPLPILILGGRMSTV